MALSKSSLKGEIAGIFSSPNQSAVAALRTATAIANYWIAGKSNLGGTPVVATIIPIINNGLSSTFDSQPVSQKLAAKQITDAIDSAFLSMTITGGKHGAGGIDSAPKGTLKSGIENAINYPPTSDEFANRFSQAIHDYTTNCKVFGTGVSPDFIQPSGPLT